ncbi:GNAT family N-acetyltransferase [Rhizobium rosettiformans]|uniref:GNAT family N-acetyltransferase n=1 Tax=Rhizobium rosettiformans TaxID=1368430 RepID=UPI002866E375|nr:GNAT family N-acetyltransferase [Rhizobium rosettiformans]MDR7027198.1 ribosomal-protein-alanine N-acetyltransferase [Rhizobium rosettiformans]MDR7065319.1 ribosomal-protein-alanine N-acetyltransferase [Rhizobium rosettiformans]
MTAADAESVGRVGFDAWAANPVLNAFGVEMMVKIRLSFRRFAEEHFSLITVGQLGDEIAGWTARDGARDYISDLWVSPAHQGLGIGSALISNTLREMRAEGLKRARIDTHSANEGAIRLYKDLGFTIVWRGMQHSPSMGMAVDKVKMQQVF